jgi:hypothetical protein
LPHHRQRTPDVFGRRFRSVHGSGGRLGTHGKPEREASDEEIVPRIGRRHPDPGDEGDEAGDEDGPASTQELVQRSVGPTSDECRAQIWRAIEETSHPNFILANVEGPEVELLSTVDGGLIHSLDDGRPGAENDEEVQHEGLPPAMRHLVPQPTLFFFGEFCDSLEARITLTCARNQCPFMERISSVLKTAGVDEGVDISDDILFTHACEGVLQQGRHARLSCRTDAAVFLRIG